MKVIVVGAGPAGCTAAYRLSRMGHDVCVLEAEPRVGGRTWTLRHDGFTIDTGAFYFGHFYERTLSLLGELGERRLVTLMEDTSGLFHAGRVHPWKPASPLSVARLPNARWTTKLRAFAVLSYYALRAPDAFDLDALAAADSGETVADWARRRLGDDGLEHVARPTFEPYWLYPPEEGVALALTTFLRHTPNLKLLALPAGTGSLCESLVRDVRVELGVPVLAVRAERDGVAVETADGERRAEGVVVATDANAAAGLLKGWAGAQALARVPYARNVHVACGYRVPTDRLARFPATIKPASPATEPVAAVGILSRKAPGLVASGSEVVDVYFGERASAAMREEDAGRLAHEAAQRFLDADLPEPAFAHVFHRERAIVKPPPGHYGRMRDALRRLPPRVALAGDYLSAGIVEGAVHSGERAAAALAAQLAAAPEGRVRERVA
ncbi:MAG TPA: NAD(P)/FAD-dependent oxidoreductase [Solirubrobacteraceae bacterium]|nr:NAD(P)/FAD-dependent oxidoreductase [Solirubrobacteraceae bacterium]